MRKTVVVALLDKAYPPSHSFVDGLLASVLADVQDISVRMLVSRGGQQARSTRYLGATCLPVLYERRGVGRFLNFIRAYSVLWYILNREKSRGNRVVLFVRNDPVYLAVAGLLRNKYERLIFQSSFPHENTGSYLKRRVAMALYRTAASHIDSMLAVSPLGVKRMQELFPEVESADYIPLMADIPADVRIRGSMRGSVSDVPVFLYIGAHSKQRELETVLLGIVRACASGVRGRFVFLGGEADDVTRLMGVPGVEALVKCGAVLFHKKVDRQKVWEQVLQADIGLCLIPDLPIYRESSPTKLGEYFGCGLPVLASRGIPFQEKIVLDSGAGVLVPFESSAIADAILDLCEDIDSLELLRRKALAYAETNMSYRGSLPLVLDMLGYTAP